MLWEEKVAKNRNMHFFEKVAVLNQKSALPTFAFLMDTEKMTLCRPLLHRAAVVSFLGPFPIGVV